MNTFKLGFSPCPNDTYIFYALVHKKINLQGFDFKFIIKDVELLNNLALAKKLDITKISSHAYLYLKDFYEFLKVGAAFGRGCGPLLVSKKDLSFDYQSLKKIAIPGKFTTAFLLLKLFLVSNKKFSQPHFIFMPFNEIIDAILKGKVDAGVIIHESRFTYESYNLYKIIDLGQWWEDLTGLPVPLGGIVAKREIGLKHLRSIETLIRESIQYSTSHPTDALTFIKQYSQELSETIIHQHISLYVNDYTFDISDEGTRALEELLSLSKKLL
ncbi:MAG: 1,4-dihydroxy-6-naphthoate synthase [Thermodesulfovibrionales bacterium]|nr:1,4-dihydroxy-6-naphthoate synthase [Thermodesulfovibrionales bacterium]